MSMRVALMTLGDPDRLTGGYIYNLRVAELAPRHDAALTFVSLPETLPGAALAARACLRRAAAGADVVVCDSIVAAHVAPHLSHRPSTPIVGMLHQPPGGIDGGPVRRALRRPFDRYAYRRMPLLLVASDQLRDHLLDDGVPAEHIVVVPPGQDAPVPDAAVERPDLRGGRAVAFLCVGNWMARKGIVDLLDAFARLPEELATLHLVGDTSVEPRYERRVRQRLAEASLMSRVVVHGPVSRARVDTLYRAADAFVLPSVREPYGTVYGEAMAAGLPVIGWRAGNLPHLIEEGREGLTAAPGDLDGLAAALLRVAQDDDLRAAMARAARAAGSALPTWEQSAAAFFEALRAVASR